MADLLFKRYLWLINTLRRGEEMTFREIADKWEKSSLNDLHSILSKRTFYNHCQAIACHFGIDIECRRGRNVYYIANAEEIEEMSLAKWLTENLTSHKLDNLAMSEKILLEDVPSSRQWLDTTIDALHKNLELDVVYENYVDQSFSGRIKPLCVKLFKRRWYLLAESQKGCRTILAFDRITELHLTSRHFNYPCDFSPGDYFHDTYGIVDGTSLLPTEIIIRAYENLPQYLRSLPIHQSQRELDSRENYTDFALRLAPSFNFLQELMLHCDKLEVIAPQSLRDEIAGLLTKMKSHYDDKNS